MQPRMYFKREELQPKECDKSTEVERVEGPIIPLGDFGLLF